MMIKRRKNGFPGIQELSNRLLMEINVVKNIAVKAVIFNLLFSLTIHACTTAVISGKSTVDGRPLLLKHRDTGNLQNRLMYFNDGRYDYIGLVNSDDVSGREVWAGCNSTGFAIMNSASYNLNIGDTTSLKDREGYVMKMALQTCSTLKDFENMLKNLPKPMGLEANFGVIDAAGGAAYYETNNYGFVKFDANDPRTAPYGYIIRTNFSYTGQRKEEYGVIRKQTAEDLFHTASAVNNLSYKFLIRDVSRCLKHSLTGRDLYSEMPASGRQRKFVDFCDFIPRYSSAATVVVQGVKKGEDTGLTTMWTILGFQLSSVAVPVWVAGGKNLPSILTADSSGNAPLCEMSLNLKSKIFPLKRGSYKNYIDLSVLLNKQGTGIMQQLRSVEDAVISKSESRLKIWREKGISRQNIQKFYKWYDKYIKKEYYTIFNL